MRSHTIPQNVTGYEDKIVGMFVGRQFIYLAVGCITVFILISAQAGPLLIRIFLAFIVGALSAAMALLKLNDRGFDIWVLSFAKAVFGPTEWTWQKYEEPPAILVAPDHPQPATPAGQPTVAPAPLMDNRERVAQFEKFLQRQRSDLDPEEQNFVSNLNFGASVPQSAFAAVATQAPPPPMLTPKNPLPAKPAAPPPPAHPVDSQAPKPVASLAGSSIRPQMTISIDGFQQSVAMLSNQRVNRALSRQLLSGGILPVPVRGELHMNVDPEYQQELDRLVGFATPTGGGQEEAGRNQESGIRNQVGLGGDWQKGNDVAASVALLSPTPLVSQPVTPVQRDKPAQVEQAVATQTPVAVPVESKPTPPPSAPAAASSPTIEKTVPSNTPAVRPAADIPVAPPQSTPASVSQLSTSNPIVLTGPVVVANEQPTKPAVDPELKRQLEEAQEQAKKAMEQLEVEHKAREELEQQKQEEEQRTALLMNDYKTEIRRLQDHGSTLEQQAQAAETQMKSLQAQAEPANGQSPEVGNQVKEQQQLIDRLRGEQQKSQAFVGELMNKLKSLEHGTPAHETVESRKPSVPVSPILPPTAAEPVKPAPAPEPKATVVEVVASAPAANTPTMPQLTGEANVVNGFVKDSGGQLLAGVVVVVKDSNGEPKRALKTNKLGQFVITTPLANGTYMIEVDTKGLSFDIMKLTLTGAIVSPLEIKAK